MNLLVLGLLGQILCHSLFAHSNDLSKTVNGLKEVQKATNKLSPAQKICPEVELSPPNIQDIQLRSRKEILKLMLENQSIDAKEAENLDCQLDLVEQYVRTESVTLNCQDSDIAKEVADVALKVKETQGYPPRDNQLIAVFQFLRGKNILQQLKTGQGKSLIVAMSAILQHRLKLPKGSSSSMAVHVITPTDNLVMAALEENKKLFQATGVCARTIRKLGPGCKRASSSDIIYGTPFEFNGLALAQASSNSALSWKLLDPAVRRTVILDESDNLLVDNASGRVLQSDPDPNGNFVKHILKEIADRVKARAQSSASSAEVDTLHQEMEKWIQEKHGQLAERWQQEGKAWIKNAFQIFDPKEPWRNGVQYVLKRGLAGELEELTAILPSDAKTPQVRKSLSELAGFLEKVKQSQDVSEKLRLIRGLNRPLVELLEQLKGPLQKDPVSRSQWERLHQIAAVLIKTSQELKDQVTPQSILPLIHSLRGQVQYLSEGTGQVVGNMKFKDGIQEFLEIKHFGTIYTQPTLSVRSYSMKKYLRNALVWGLSGTVGTDDPTLKFQKQVWVVDRAVTVPEFAISQLKQVAPPVVEKDKSSWMTSIIETTRRRMEKQPVLVITENPERAEELKAKFIQEGLRPALYTGDTDEHLLYKNLGPGDVIITTNLGGRGSDYKYDKAKSPQGLHEILGFDSDEARIIEQAIGRAGRAGNPGTWQQISYGEPLKQKPDLKELRRSVENTIVDDMTFEVYRALTQMAPSQSPVQPQLTKSVTDWLSSPQTGFRLRKMMLKPDANPEELTREVLREWVDYLSTLKTGSHRSALVKVSQTQLQQVKENMTKALGVEAQELQRLRTY